MSQHLLAENLPAPWAPEPEEELAHALRHERFTVLTHVPGAEETDSSEDTASSLARLLPLLRRRSGDAVARLVERAPQVILPFPERRSRERARLAELVVIVDAGVPAPLAALLDGIDAALRAAGLDDLDALDRGALPERVRAVSARYGTRLLLIIDGFAACLTPPAANDEPREALLDQLAQLLNRRLTANVLVVVAADAMPRLASFVERLDFAEFEVIGLTQDDVTPAEATLVEPLDHRPAGVPMPPQEARAADPLPLRGVICDPPRTTMAVAEALVMPVPARRPAPAPAAAPTPVPAPEPVPVSASASTAAKLVETEAEAPAPAPAPVPVPVPVLAPIPVAIPLPTASSPTPTPRRRAVPASGPTISRKGRFAAAMAVLLAALVLGAWWARHGTPTAPVAQAPAVPAAPAVPQALPRAPQAAVTPKTAAIPAPTAQPAPGSAPGSAQPAPAIAALPTIDLAVEQVAGEGLPRLPVQLAQALGRGRDGVALRVREVIGDPASLMVGGAPHLAIVRYDILQAAAQGRTPPTLGIVAPLYTEELYAVVRADSPLRYLHELRGRRINVGPDAGSRALTARALYLRMFGQPLPSSDTTRLDAATALRRLAAGASLDAVVLMSPQPASLWQTLAPETRRQLKLLALQPGDPASRRALSAYLPATLKPLEAGTGTGADATGASSTPAGATPTLASVAFLVAVGTPDAAMADTLVRATRSLCTALPALRSEGDPKWREVRGGLQLATGWPDAPGTAASWRACTAPP